MRKWLIVFLTVLGLATQANAQDFSIRAGLGLVFSNPITFGVDAKLYALSVARIAPAVNLGIIGNIGLNFGGGVAGAVSAGPAIVFSFDRGSGFVYAGINLGLAFDSSGTAFIFAFVTGVDYAVNSNLGLFADLSLVVVPFTFGSFDLGVDFGLSRTVDAYVKLSVGFGGSGRVGIGGGLKFAL